MISVMMNSNSLNHVILVYYFEQQNSKQIAFVDMMWALNFICYQ